MHTACWHCRFNIYREMHIWPAAHWTQTMHASIRASWTRRCLSRARFQTHGGSGTVCAGSQLALRRRQRVLAECPHFPAPQCLSSGSDLAGLFEDEWSWCCLQLSGSTAWPTETSETLAPVWASLSAVLRRGRKVRFLQEAVSRGHLGSGELREWSEAVKVEGASWNNAFRSKSQKLH